MIRKYIFSVGLFLFICLSLFSQEVKLDIAAPESIVAGEAVVINIHISKGSLTGFARLQQSFPLAVDVKSDNSGGGDFNFVDGRLNIIWLNLPGHTDLDLSYTLSTHETVKGTLILEGKFSYIVDSDREELEIRPQTINISPSPLVSPDLVVDINEYKGVRPGADVVDEDQVVVVVREKPYLSDSGDGWIVNLLVSKGALKKLARLEEIVPANYTAENLKNHNAIFSFKEGVVKYLWMNLPREEYFTVSYKLIPLDGNMEKNPLIKGGLTYMDNEELNTFSVVEKGDALHKMDDRELSNFIAAFTAEVSGQSVQRPVEATKIINEPLPVKQGIYFRVQILATSKPVNAERYFSRLHLGEIFKEQHEGLYKYTTGTFTLYKDARAYVDKLSRLNLNEAFVTAYEDGERISVKKALRQARQRWFK